MGWGLYLDEGSTHITLEDNVVYNTKTGGFHQHYGKENVIRNNIFAFGKLYQLQVTRVENHRSFSFTNNIVIGDEGVLLHGPWLKVHIFMDKNCYWFVNHKHFDFAGLSFEAWKKQTGHDRNSMIADPGKFDPRTGTFELNRKIARRIDFKEIK